MSMNGKQRAVRLALVVLVLLCAVGLTAASDRMDRKAAYWTLAIRLPTALSYEEISRLGLGEALPLSLMDEKTRSEVIASFGEMCQPSLYEAVMSRLPAGTPVGLHILVEREMTLVSEALASPLRIPLDSDLPEVKHGTLMREEQIDLTPNLGPRPDLDQILGAQPADPVARDGYLREWAFELLRPIGERRLAEAIGSEVPFTEFDFAARRSVKIAALTQQQSDWVAAGYAAALYRVEMEREVLRRAGAEPGAVGSEGDPMYVVGSVDGEQVVARAGEVPKSPLPQWTELGDASVVLGVRYAIGVRTLPGEIEPGDGQYVMYEYQ